jgi:hypothetical protein
VGLGSRVGRIVGVRTVLVGAADVTAVAGSLVTGGVVSEAVVTEVVVAGAVGNGVMSGALAAGVREVGVGEPHAATTSARSNPEQALAEIGKPSVSSDRGRKIEPRRGDRRGSVRSVSAGARRA